MKTTIYFILAISVGFILGWISQRAYWDSEVTDFIEGYQRDLMTENHVLALTALGNLRQYREGRIEAIEQKSLVTVAFFYGMYGPQRRSKAEITDDMSGTFNAIEREMELNQKLRDAVANELAKYPES